MGSEYDSDELASAMAEKTIAQPWAMAGSDMFASMLANAKEDRLNTKLAVLDQRLRSTAVKTEEKAAVVWNRFQFFRQHVLKKSQTETPTTEEIQRFLLAYPAHVKAHNPTGRPSVRSISNTLSLLVSNAQLRFRDFSVTASDTTRLRNTIQGLLADGTITARKRARHWVTSTMIVRLVRGILVDGYNHGSNDWDRTVADSLLLSLQSALGCRMGDIILTDSTYAEAYLKFSDIAVFLQDGALVAQVCLRWTKGTKDDPVSDTSDFELREIQDRSVAVACPVQLLLVYALRTGAVAETTFEEVLKSMSCHPDKELVWAQPTRPVFCQRARNQALLPRFDRPMTSANSGNKILSRAAKISGLPSNITTHDIRRGTALEVSRLPVYDGLNIQNARANLGHQGGSWQADQILHEYVGFVTPDTLAARIQKAVEEPPRIKRRLRFEKPELVPVKRPRLPTAASLPSPVRPQRLPHLAVAVGPRQTDVDDYQDDDQEEILLSLSESSLPSPTALQPNASLPVVARPPQLSPHQNRTPEKDVTLASTSGSSSPRGDPRDVAVGPWQVEIGKAVEDLIPGTGLAGELDETLQGLTESAADELAADDIFTSALQASRNTWIEFLSTYNVLACPRGELPPPTVQETSGGSRDPPTFYRWVCPTCDLHPHGWTEKTRFQDHIDGCHPDGNPGTAPVAVEQEAQKQASPTEEENNCPTCGREFSSRTARVQHIYEFHAERGCPVVGCGLRFEGVGRVKRHWVKEHCTYKPMVCPIADCVVRKGGRNEPSLHADVNSLRGHLRNFHKGVDYPFPDEWKFPGFKSAGPSATVGLEPRG